MHLLIPYAYGHDEACRQAFHRLPLPALRKLLARLQPGAVEAGDEWSLSPPHERVHARALGLPGADGLIPWAAWQAGHARLQHVAPHGAWGYLSPSHWQAGMDRLTMGGPGLPELDEAESRALMDTLAAFVQQDGVTLHFDRADRWLAQGELLRELPSASLDRVLGQDLEPWISRHSGAEAWRRLQSELQMLLHSHPVNDARAARGAPVINSLWLHGTGSLPEPSRAAPADAAPLTMAGQLREPALAGDWQAWGQAWQELDATLCAEALGVLQRGGAPRLTLCGQRQARTWVAQPAGLTRRFKALFGAAPDLRPLEQL